MSEGQPSGEMKMALGAVLITLPIAMIGAYAICAVLGLNAGLGLLAYAALGTVALACILVFFGARRG